MAEIAGVRTMDLQRTSEARVIDVAITAAVAATADSLVTATVTAVSVMAADALRLQ